MIEALSAGFADLADLQTLTALAVGVLLGYLVGALPGMTTAMGMALLLPFTFTMDPVSAMVMLVALYVAGDYAGAIPAILVNAPGQPAAAITALDGYPMTKNGKAADALSLSLMSSAIGGAVGLVLLIGTAEIMSTFALAFGPAEYFGLAVAGLSLIGTLSGSVLKGLIGLFIGLTLVVVGIDPISGSLRYVYADSLLDGISFIPALIGLFALSEVLFIVEDAARKAIDPKAIGKVRFSAEVLRKHPVTAFRSGITGYLVGVIPGAGASIASVVSYATAKRLAPKDDTFGTGNPKGVVASEAANNACSAGAIAPLLALGIPGSGSAAVLIGALMIHGVQPGPLLFTNNPEIPYAIFAALIIGLPIMLMIGLLGGKIWVTVTAIPKSVLAAVVASVCIVGAYASNNDIFSVWIAVVLGVVGYLLRKCGIHPAPIILALVLGELMETSLRRAIIIFPNDHLFFLDSPICAALLGFALLVLVAPTVTKGLPLIVGNRKKAPST